MGLHQRLLQVIGPGAAGLDELGFEIALIGVGNGPRLRFDDDVEAGEIGVGHLGVEGRDFAGVGLRQDVLHAQPEFRGQPVAREVEEAGDEAFEGVAPGE